MKTEVLIFKMDQTKEWNIKLFFFLNLLSRCIKSSCVSCINELGPNQEQRGFTNSAHNTNIFNVYKANDKRFTITKTDYLKRIIFKTRNKIIKQIICGRMVPVVHKEINAFKKKVTTYRSAFSFFEIKNSGF